MWTNIYEVSISGVSCYTSRDAIEATLAGRWSLSGNSWASLASAVLGHIFMKKTEVKPFYLDRIGGNFVFSGSTCRHTLQPSGGDLKSTDAGRSYLTQLRATNIIRFTRP
jgi:hypothetical protein